MHYAMLIAFVGNQGPVVLLP